MKFKKAFKVFTKALREDKGLYVAYQSNIAMAYVDSAREEATRDSYKKLHMIANNAAHNFLKQLLKKQPAETKQKRKGKPCQTDTV